MHCSVIFLLLPLLLLQLQCCCVTMVLSFLAHEQDKGHSLHCSQRLVFLKTVDYPWHSPQLPSRHPCDVQLGVVSSMVVTVWATGLVALVASFQCKCCGPFRCWHNLANCDESAAPLKKTCKQRGNNYIFSQLTCDFQIVRQALCYCWLF